MSTMAGRRRRRAAAMAAGCLAALAAAAPASGGVPAGARHFEAWFRADEGKSCCGPGPAARSPRLHADVFLPERATGRVPVLLNIGPYNGSGPLSTSLNGTAEDPDPPVNHPALVERARLFERGFGLVQVDLRGYGSSEGCSDFMGRGEQADVAAAVDWVARQPWSNGRIGAFGLSYDGWAALAALASRHPALDAVLAAAPNADPYAASYFDRVPLYSRYAIRFFYDAYDAEPPALTRLEQLPAALDNHRAEPGCGADDHAAIMDADPGSAFWRERRMYKRAAGRAVPVFFVHGLRDTNTYTKNFLPMWRRLRNRHNRLWVGQWHHAWPLKEHSGRDGFADEAMAFFERHLLGARGPRQPRVVAQDADGRWRAARAWPPRNARTVRFPLLGGSYRDAYGNAAERYARLADGLPSFPLPPTTRVGVGVWTFTAPATGDAHLVGSPRVSVRVARAPAGARLVALLYDVAPDGTARFISRGATELQGAGAAAVTVLPHDWRLAKGHRLGTLLAATDDTTFSPPTTGGEVVIEGGTLDARFLRRRGRTVAEGAKAAIQVQEGPFPVPVDMRQRTAGGPPPRMRP